MSEKDSSGALTTLLHSAGIAPETAQTVQQIDALLQHWRRRAMKRELGSRALTDLRIDLDLAHLDVLSAINGPDLPAGDEARETMVATVAERLGIDPSRASRLVSEMVERGYARRGVSQADARRTIIELTDRGSAVLDAVRAYKLVIMGEILGEWPTEELGAFVRTLKRFSTWTDGIDAAAGKHESDIARIAAMLQVDEQA